MPVVSPKTRFLRQAVDVAAHRELVSSTHFLNAIDAALLQMQQKLVNGAGDLAMAAANFNKLAGARELVDTLLTLTDVASAPARRDPDNLTAV